MHNPTSSTITVIFLSGIGFLFLGIVLAPILRNIETPTLAIFGVVFIVFAIAAAVYAQKQAARQIHDITGTIDGTKM